MIRAAVNALPSMLRDRREGRMTRTELAARTGIEVSALRRIEAGQPPSVEQLLLICDVLGVAPWDLLGPLRTGDPASRTVEVRSNGNIWRSVTPEVTLPNPVEQTIKAGTRDATAQHDGTEWIYLVEGHLVEVNFGRNREPRLLRPHEAIDFDASIPHWLFAGLDDAVVLRRLTRSGLDAHVPELGGTSGL
ncbi:hypothetical protein DEI81_11240 [Curtobacterium sp. MCBD17_013]|nr:hypothetical protein DEI81_11240 [Curtobacterium sp. MCBD17_013]